MTIMQSNLPAQDPKAITGKTVLVWLICFFAVIFAANAVLLYLALGSFPGVVVESSYQAGQNYNHDIAAAKAQAGLGWQVETGLVRTTETAARLDVTALDSSGVALSGLSFVAVLKHPTHEGVDISVVLAESRPGHYISVLSNVPAGNWLLEIEASKADKRLFRSENRLFLAN